MRKVTNSSRKDEDLTHFMIAQLARRFERLIALLFLKCKGQCDFFYNLVKIRINT